MTAASRAQEYRQRRKLGVRKIIIEIETAAIEKALVGVGLLDGVGVGDQEAIEQAITELLADWAEGWSRHA